VYKRQAYLGVGLLVVATNLSAVPDALLLIVQSAFGFGEAAGGAIGYSIAQALQNGARRGLFSNEAGQGSAPIAHAAAKTDEPVSEGVVALVEPFIDTIVICTLTGLVIILTGVWSVRVPTEITLGAGDISYVQQYEEGRFSELGEPARIEIVSGRYADDSMSAPMVAWHEVVVEQLFVDAEMQNAFSGHVDSAKGIAVAADGTEYASLHGMAAESGAPLTMVAFERGLPGRAGKFIVVVSVFLFAISTAIAWSYYGDRCANYLFGRTMILPYKAAFVTMHFVGAVLSLSAAWTLGDVFLGIVILPNLLALLLLSPKVAELTKSYFQRKPWIENREVHKRLKEQKGRRGH
jgi:AGCS family alanine or glycine:cation symporter